MERDPEMFAALNYIKNKVEALEKIELLRMRNDKAMKEQYEQFLSSDRELLAIYQAVDGTCSQKEIAAKAGIKEMQVSRKIKIIADLGLIEVIDVRKDGSVLYGYTVAERAFKLSRMKNGE